MKLDVKFYGEIRKVKDGSIVPEDEYMVFLVHDKAFLETLGYYRSRCVSLRCDAEHIAAVDRTIANAKAWQEANPEKMKVPDAAGEKLLG